MLLPLPGAKMCLYINMEARFIPKHPDRDDTPSMNWK